ncbi:MAG: cytochrome c-type biogenesis protein CcmH [Fidelibacterota bacterium]
MLRQVRRAVLALAAILQLGMPLGAQPDVILGQIKKSLICLCDCNMTVDACQGAMDCQSAENLSAEASALIGLGMGKNDVLSRLVDRYGEQILSAPTKRGFNLTAWILPFVALFLATIGIVAALGKWVKSRHGISDRSLKPVDPEYEEKLDEVLRDLG